MSGGRAVFEFDTHEVVVWDCWIYMDGHRAVHLGRPYQMVWAHPQGVVVDGVLVAFHDLLRIIRHSDDEDEDEDGYEAATPALMDLH